MPTFSTALREFFFKGGGIYPHLKSADPSQLTEKRVSSEYMAWENSRYLAGKPVSFQWRL